MHTLPNWRIWAPAAVLAAIMLPAAVWAQNKPAVKTAAITVKSDLSHIAKRTLLAFPADVDSTLVGNADDVAGLINDVTSSRFNISQIYSLTRFGKRLAPIARLVSEKQLTDTDITSPYSSDNIKPVKISSLAGFDLAFVTSVDDYKYDDAAKSVDITVSGRLLEVETGKVIKSSSHSGTSKKGMKGAEAELALDAARTATEGLMMDIIPLKSSPNPSVPATTVKKKRDNSAAWLVGCILLGIGLGVGLSSGGSGGGSVIETPPAPPGH